MKQFGKLMSLALGFGLLAAVLSYIPSRPAAAMGAAPVLVTNMGASQAVPVSPQGTTPVSGTVAATQNGTWNVGISGTPTVNLGAGNTVGINGSLQVGNTASSPVLVRDVDNAARLAFQASASITLADGTTFATSTITTVPAGKRLVIEYISALAATQTGQKALAQIQVYQGTTPYLHRVALSLQGTFTTSFGTGDEFVAGQSTRLYADAGTAVIVEIGRSASSGAAKGVFVISGYLVDCGAGDGCPLP